MKVGFASNYFKEVMLLGSLKYLVATLYIARNRPTDLPRIQSTLDGLERVASLLLHAHELPVTNQLKFFQKLIALILAETSVQESEPTKNVLVRIGELFQQRLDGVQKQGLVTESETAAKYSPAEKLKALHESLRTEDPHQMDEELAKLTDKLNVSPKVTFEKDKESISLHLSLYNNKQEAVAVEEAIKELWAVSGTHVDGILDSKH